jgi:eukaryotic-like serine/threonine-protein kinase
MSGQEPSDNKVGGYEILGELSTGGMGKVFLARRSSVHRFERLVALKVIRADLGQEPELRAMFLDEACLMARLHHPAIAQVYDFGEEENVLFLAMEYVAGVNFEKLKKKGIPPAAAARLMAQVCYGLHAAHGLTDNAGKPLGVVHRDVSPQNLMLTFEGAVKILDFGIAWMRDRQTPATEFGQVKGKPAYMAPEQVRNDPVDPRTDLFSTAIVLYELLTKKRLFFGDSLYAVARAVEHHEIVPPLQLVEGLPAELNEIVMRGLERDPAKRFQNGREMALALESTASKLGGESLESYAQRELAASREENQRWLKEVLTRSDPQGVAGEAIPGRPEGAVTLSMHSLSSGEAEPAKTPVLSKKVWGGRVLFFGMMVALGLGLAWGGWEAYQIFQPLPPVEAPIREVAKMPMSMPAPVLVAIPNPDPKEEVAPVADSPTEKSNKDQRRNPSRVKKSNPLPTQVSTTAPAPEPAPTPAPKSVLTPEPDSFGSITVGADPYAMVDIDGKQIGITPILRHKIPVGEHEVLLLSPDTGQIRLRRKVTIRENEHQEVILK